ncbi:hypothetical protein RHMOL_Rhmol01G0353100 [Rhododendron molle]|uniref:Uncharacterized protein n=1 Tax=Rhododendron molle TaxID=49168 RepID=A0ACC0Q8T9_RHOML|nr:hypothetical protein RHMOL_Rhmol01G0353100 [Rhododendron molle]
MPSRPSGWLVMAFINICAVNEEQSFAVKNTLNAISIYVLCTIFATELIVRDQKESRRKS